MKKSLSIFLIAAVVLVSGLTFSAHARPLGDTVPTATPDPNVKHVHQPRTPVSVSAKSGITDVSPQAVCSNPIVDPSFEGGIPNPSWYEFSIQFGTPLCSTSSCPTVSAGPHTGTVWAWFGGAETGDDEFGIISQTVTIMTNTASLSFYLRVVTASGGGADDFFNAWIDTTKVFTATALDAGSYPAYKQVTVNVSPFADGAAHIIVFTSETYYQTISFHVDDISLCAFAATSKVYVPSLRR